MARITTVAELIMISQQATRPIDGGSSSRAGPVITTRSPRRSGTGQAVPSHRDWQEDRRCRLELVQVLRSAGYSFDAIAQLVAGCTARDRTQTRAALATRQAQLRKQTRAAVATSELNGLINDLKAR